MDEADRQLEQDALVRERLKTEVGGPVNALLSLGKSLLNALKPEPPSNPL